MEIFNVKLHTKPWDRDLNFLVGLGQDLHGMGNPIPVPRIVYYILRKILELLHGTIHNSINIKFIETMNTPLESTH